jgi:hypothetical protein
LPSCRILHMLMSISFALSFLSIVESLFHINSTKPIGCIFKPLFAELCFPISVLNTLHLSYPNYLYLSQLDNIHLRSSLILNEYSWFSKWNCCIY